MPPVNVRDNESTAFTVITHDAEKLSLARNVNVVRPLERDEPRGPLPSAPRPRPAPHTLLDPKFSRALDFKLRRLKEKEILEANLRRPTRFRPRNGLAASNPNICRESPRIHARTMSQSHPRINDVLEDLKISPKLEKSPSPTKSRGKMSVSNDGDKPRFVTTVKTGQFLLPPPEVACLLGLETLYPPKEREKIVYSYASKPKAIVNRSKRSLPDKKEGAKMCPNIDGRKRIKAGDAFRGVRALMAGLAGVHHVLEEQDRVGSMATGVTGGTGVTGATQYSNVMHDKRVVRGSTFAAHPHAAGDGMESAAARAARTRRRALARRAALARLRPGTPPPAPGRRHHPIQTEYYLEELFDKGVEMEVGVQTDLFADRPATPVYVPAKTGADATTQIYPGNLFDFDVEVQPILEVLIGKTVEQALAEVAQEEELATLREQQRRYRELRDAELAERQRLAAQDLRLEHEKERRVAEGRAARAAAVEARQRVAAAALVQGYVAELLPAVLAGLRDAGYLARRLHRGVEEEFMPWLVEEVSKEIESIITSRDVISDIVREVVEARAELYRAANAREGQRRSPPESLTPPSAAEGEEEEHNKEEPQ